MPHETPLISTIAVGLAFAFLFGLIAARLKVPAIVGYLFAGIAVGPFTPGFVGDSKLAVELSEIGVILLMFGVGLHFSVKDLLRVRSIAVPGALAQIAVATGLGMLLANLWGWELGAGLVFGLALSVASTVVLLRALEERGALESGNGRIAVGWLIVEDLVMVLALVLLPALAVPLGGQPLGLAGSLSEGNILLTLLITLAKVAAFVALMLIVGTRLVPWLLGVVVRIGSRELFTLAILAVALGVAFGSSVLFGVSFALGAFFAGIVVGESDLSHRVAADALPLRDAFAVLFFVSVGMLFDPSILVREPIRVLLVLGVIIVGKSLAAFALVLLLRYPIGTAITVSASLAQIGEFSFILASLGVGLNLLPEEGQSLILAGALLSITLNPLVFRAVPALERFVTSRPRLRDAFERPSGALSDLPATLDKNTLRDHVVIVGYGRAGRPVGRVLERQGVPFLVVEQNRQFVQELRALGVPTIYGDASNPAILEHAYLERSKLLVVASPDALEARRMIEHALGVNPGIGVVVRTHSEAEEAHLAALGVGRVVMGERELGASLAQFALEALGVSVDEAEQSARAERFDATQAVDVTVVANRPD